jgi:DNA primase
MFPIFDRRGRVIAFGGRVLEKDDGPKYLNSPETPLFHKGRELYGLWQVKQAHNKILRLIVVEGYMDVVSLFQHGITQAVATLGTATTPDHAELLFRNSTDVYFCFDGDKAGRAAAWKAVESIIPRMRDGRQAFFLFLPDGEDPDSIVKTEGANGFEQRLQQATSLSDYFFSELGKNANLNNLEGRARLAETVKPYLAKIPDGAFRDLMQERLHQLSGVKHAVIETEKPIAKGRSISPKRSLVRAIITLLMQNPQLGLSIQVPFGFEKLDQPGVGLLVELLNTIHLRPEITTASLLESFEQHTDNAALQKLAMLEIPGDDSSLKLEFSDALEQLAKQYRQQRLIELRQQMAQAGLSAQENIELRELLQARA